MIRINKAQSTLEYLIILMVIVAAVLAASATVKSAVETRINSAAEVLAGNSANSSSSNK